MAIMTTLRMERFVKHLFVLFIISFTIGCSGQNLSDVVPCPSFTPVPIIGNPAALEILREWCTSDSRCAEQYGQVITAKPEVFNTLFQSTTHSFTGTLFLQSPLIEKICAMNMTWEQVNELLWIVFLRLDILERGRSCYEGKTPMIDSETNEITCKDLPWSQEAEIRGFNSLGLAIEIAIFVVVVISIVLQIWNFVRNRQPQIL